MSDDTRHDTPEKGMQVHGADGMRIGQITQLEDDFMVVDKGPMLDEIFVPRTIVGRIQQGVVVLTMSREAVEGKDWTAAARGTTMTLGYTPAEERTEALNQVSTTAQPGFDSVVDVDTDAFDDTGMDTNKRPNESKG